MTQQRLPGIVPEFEIAYEVVVSGSFKTNAYTSVAEAEGHEAAYYEARAKGAFASADATIEVEVVAKEINAP